MQHYFYDYKEICMNNYIFRGIIMSIKEYKKINIKTIKNNELYIIMFFKIVYIFNYSVNLISMNKIKIKKIYWNNEHKKFIKNKKFFFDVKIYGN